MFISATGVLLAENEESLNPSRSFFSNKYLIGTPIISSLSNPIVSQKDLLTLKIFPSVEIITIPIGAF